MQLRQLDPTYPSPILKLPAEIWVDVIRHAVTSPTGTIPADDSRTATDRLLRPFRPFPKLLAEAEHRIPRHNTFTLDFFPRRTSSLSQCLPLDRRLGYGIDHFVRNIEHLRLNLEILLEGGKYDTVDQGIRSVWRRDDDLVSDVRGLQRLLPKLQTLEVVVENYDAPGTVWKTSSSGEEPIDYKVWGRRHKSSCPHFGRFKRAERMLLMQRTLLVLCPLTWPRLQKKTLTFVQREGPKGAMASDCSYYPVLTTSAPGRKTRLSPEEKVRFGLLFCHLMATPTSKVEEGTSEPRVLQRMTTEELAEMKALDWGGKDQMVLDGILELPRATLDLSPGKPGVGEMGEVVEVEG